MSAHTRRGFRVGSFRVWPERNRIAGTHGEMRVEPKAMAVLLELACAEGRTVRREDLLQAVWPRGFVTDDVLTRCIGQLRKAFSDTARGAGISRQCRRPATGCSPRLKRSSLLHRIFLPHPIDPTGRD